MKRILSIDYGQKYIGTALSSEITQEPVLAFSYKVFENTKDFFKEIKRVIKKEAVGLVIVGLPLSFNFQDTKQTKIVRTWTRNLKKEISTPIIFENEIFSSKIAAKKASGESSKKEIHSKAAQEILQSYLDRNRLPK